MDNSIATIADDLIYVEDVMTIFGGKISKASVYGLVREKRLPAMKIGRRFVFSRKTVLEYIQKHVGIRS